ncbi:MAG TPA: hypothetical protein VMH48_04890 [Methylomirabilota bacterium]|nr:hypothetical protein [Methylomirabilota bacterium]
MPPKSPQTSYTKKPVRRLRLPKIGPPKTKGFFEEYFYATLGVFFVVVAVLGWAGGMTGYEALVIAAWLTGFAWFARMLRDYFREKSKVKGEKEAATAAKPEAEAAKGPASLPAGMKPIIGLKWPVKSGPFPNRPGLRTAPSIPPELADKAATQTTPAATQAGPPNSTWNSNANKPGFVYQRPTLPDRKPKLPHNWPGQNNKKPKR